MRMNNRSSEPVKLNGESVEEVTEFVYLGTKMTHDGDTTTEIYSRISRARQTFAILKNTWKSKNISTKTKVRIFKSNVLSTLLYGSESWKVTKTINQKLDAFQNRCLRRILNVFWPNIITNEVLHRATSTKPISLEIKKRRWKWLGHVLRMQSSALPKVALRWTGDGKRKRGRPKETWRRTLESEMRKEGWTWGEIQRRATDRTRWRMLVEILCADQHEED